MIEPAQSAALFTLFLTGLAGSLHCVGMCGPLLLGFSSVLDAGGEKRHRLDFAYYHAGRLWTYGLLGLIAGWAGSGLREGSIHLGWQKPLAILIAVLVIGSGAAALGWIPGLRFELSSPGTCLKPLQPGTSRSSPLGRTLASFLRQPSRSGRLLLGAVMGLLPCGLVYTVLLIAATLPTPLHAAVAMICFGAGTLPALSAVVLAGRLAPPWLRLHGTRLAALMLLGIGLFMLARALGVPMAAHGAH